MSKRAIFPLIFFLGSLLSAQNPNELLGSWTEIIGQNKISEKLSIPTILIFQHYRFYDQLQFGAFRTGLTYHFSHNASGTLGYDYIFSEAFSEKTSSVQHRLWEELVLRNRYLDLAVSHRYRFESTWTKDNPINSPAHRVRYRLRLEHRLYKSFYATAFDELFVNLNQPYFNQNRLHLGLGYSFHPNLKMEAGYFKIHFGNLNFDRIRLGIIFKTDSFSKKAEEKIPPQRNGI